MLLWITLFGLFTGIVAQAPETPEQMRGSWFSYESGEALSTNIQDKAITNSNFQGDVLDIVVSQQITEGYWDQIGLNATVLLKDSPSELTSCYYCLELLLQTPNVIQRRKAGPQCNPVNVPTLPELCSQISDKSELVTSFREDVIKMNCKNTFEGVYHFTYQIDMGGGGICDSQDSKITACQAEGSPYRNNEAFFMNFGYCSVLADNLGQEKLYNCLGTWRDGRGYIYGAVSDAGQERGEDRFRCFLTRDDQQMENNQVRWVMSNTPVCSTLIDPYTGPYKLVLQPTLYDVQRVEPSCNLPRNFSGQWYHTGEYDSNVIINGTHMVWRTATEQYERRETVYSCQQAMAGRYLMAAFIIGRCELDYVCFDFLPRHQNIVRFRMGKPFRHKVSDAQKPEYLQKIYKRACYWSAFTFDREDPDFKYQALILNPPTPIMCPIRGRYKFAQYGQEQEKYRTRIPGFTERPWLQVDCKDKESDWAVCLRDTQKVEVDAERCVTVDHIAKPIGEYDFPDHRLSCAGYWMEDYRSYLVTYDDDDPISKFRCWVYERTGVRTISMSRAFRATCGDNQTARSRDPSEGASLQLELIENEYIHDDCPMGYTDGRNPWSTEVDQSLLFFFDAAAVARPSLLLTLVLGALLALLR